jgi:hypothetical protein
MKVKKYKGDRLCVVTSYDPESGNLNMLAYGYPDRTIRTYKPGREDPRLGEGKLYASTMTELYEAILQVAPGTVLLMPVTLAIEAYGLKQRDFADLYD